MVGRSSVGTIARALLFALLSLATYSGICVRLFLHEVFEP